MAPPEERVEDVAAVELADGQQVHGRGEHSHPGRARHRVQVNVGRGHSGEDQALEQKFERRNAEAHVPLVGDARNHLGKGQPHRKRR